MSWFWAGVTVERKTKKLLSRAHALHVTFRVYCTEGSVLSMCYTTLGEKQMVSTRFSFFGPLRLNTFVEFMNLILGRENVTLSKKVELGYSCFSCGKIRFLFC